MSCIWKRLYWNLSTCSCENGEYLTRITNDSAIKCDEVTESYDKETHFYKKKATCKTQNFYILLAFSWKKSKRLVGEGKYLLKICSIA